MFVYLEFSILIWIAWPTTSLWCCPQPQWNCIGLECQGMVVVLWQPHVKTSVHQNVTLPVVVLSIGRGYNCSEHRYRFCSKSGVLCAWHQPEGACVMFEHCVDWYYNGILGVGGRPFQKFPSIQESWISLVYIIWLIWIEQLSPTPFLPQYGGEATHQTRTVLLIWMLPPRMVGQYKGFCVFEEQQALSAL